MGFLKVNLDEKHVKKVVSMLQKAPGMERRVRWLKKTHEGWKQMFGKVLPYLVAERGLCVKLVKRKQEDLLCIQLKGLTHQPNI